MNGTNLRKAIKKTETWIRKRKYKPSIGDVVGFLDTQGYDNPTKDLILDKMPSISDIKDWRR